MRAWLKRIVQMAFLNPSAWAVHWERKAKACLRKAGIFTDRAERCRKVAKEQGYE